MKRLASFGAVLALLASGGCIAQHSVHVDPIQVQPIRVQMDVDVRVDRSHSDQDAQTHTEEADRPLTSPSGG